MWPGRRLRQHGWPAWIFCDQHTPKSQLSPRTKEQILMFCEGVQLLASLEQCLHRKGTGLSLNVFLLHFSQRSIEFRVSTYGTSVNVKDDLA